MKKAVLFSVMGMLAAAGSGAWAQEVGRVISSTPLIQQVAVPRQVCSHQPMAVQQPNSGAGALLGAIAGGAMGNAIGHGSGRAAATAIGLVGGAALGNNIEGSGSYVQNVQHCTTQTYYENRTTGYNVVYEYAGKQFTAQLPYDPGATIPLHVGPVAGQGPDQPMATAPAPSTNPNAGAAVGVILGQPMVQQYTTVVPAPVVYPSYYPAYQSYPVYPAPAYYPRPRYAPIGISLGIGYHSGGHRHRHRHRH